MNKEEKANYRKVGKYCNRQIKKYTKLAKRKNIPEEEYMTQMRDQSNIIEIDDLHTFFFTDVGVVQSVNGVSFDIPRGATVALVGESGCGKSVTSLSMMRLVQAPVGQIVKGEIRYNRGDGTAINIAKAPITLMQKMRGNEISMIFQEPMTSMNPVFTVGAQIDEVIKLHNPDWDDEKIKARTIEMLNLVGIADTEKRYRAYPHELSGGMRQRAMIAMALACDPGLIIADEPTTALDVTIQAQILDLLRDIKKRINASILLITHDLGVVAEMADYVVVMYAGRIIEAGTARDVYLDPKHPYTIGLLKSKPSVSSKREKRLYSIPGSVPSPINMPNHCFFRDRCEMQVNECRGGEYPGFVQVSDTHKVACYREGKGVSPTPYEFNYDE